MARLVLINGAPGSGKSTLARLLAQDEPLAMALDVDAIKHSLGQGRTAMPASGVAARRLAIAMASEHLRQGHDVIVAQFLARTDFIIELEALAGELSVTWAEFVLSVDEEELRVRLAERAQRPQLPEQLVNNELVSLDDAEQPARSIEGVIARRPSAAVIDANGTVHQSAETLRRHLDRTPRSTDESYRVAGVLLAAGAGRRMGGPKALLRHPGGRSWVASAVRMLLDGGCDEVIVVVGARGDEVADELGAEGLDVATGVEVVRAEGWESGMGASLRAGLAALELPERRLVDAALVHLVDIPDVAAPVVRRLLASAARHDDVLARAGYHGVPGHPVLIGRHHWVALSTGLEGARGDRGAREYLAGRQVQLVECADLASGHDVDRPDDVPRADQFDAGAG